MFSKKATKIDEIFTVDLTVTTYCQIDGEDFVNFCGLLRKRELYPRHRTSWDQKFRDFEAWKTPTVLDGSATPDLEIKGPDSSATMY